MKHLIVSLTFITITSVVLPAGRLNSSFAAIVAVQSGQDDQARKELYERFNSNRKTDPKAAYEAAKEYLSKYPTDDSKDAQFIKQWIAAYEKVVAKVQVESQSLSAPAPAESANVKSPSITNTSLAGMTWHHVATNRENKKHAYVLMFRWGGKLEYDAFYTDGTVHYTGTWRQVGNTVYIDIPKTDEHEALAFLGSIDGELMAATRKRGGWEDRCSFVSANAETNLREAIRRELNKPLYHDQLGVALIMQEKYLDAEKEILLAIKIDSNNPKYYCDLGIALYRQRNLQKAESAFRQAVKLEPTNAKYHVNLAIVLYDQNQKKLAKEEFKEAQKLDSFYVQQYRSVGDWSLEY